MLRNPRYFAVCLTLAVHAAVLAWLGAYSFRHAMPLEELQAKKSMVYLDLIPTPSPLQSTPQDMSVPSHLADIQAPTAPEVNLQTFGAPERTRLSMVAPPPPTAQEWAFAARYALKNSKAYRYSWGQQVRSMMGTVEEGPDQGFVRFRIEIAPDGKLVQLQTLWTTSAAAEQLARQAIHNMPPLPPTPTGKPLVFEKTIAFSPFASDGPPLYKDDCLPDVPVFRNPFAWDGKAPRVVTAPTALAQLGPEALADCLRQLPQDSVEAESAHDQRQLEQWGSARLKP